jgi:hypothetical protein
MPAPASTSIDGLTYDDYVNNVPALGLMATRALRWFGQTINKVTGNVANEQIGTLNLPVLAATTTGTVTLTNSKITANSLIFLSVCNKTNSGGAGDTTAAREVTAWVENQPTAGSATVGYYTSVLMSQAWCVHYLIIN